MVFRSIVCLSDVCIMGRSMGYERLQECTRNLKGNVIDPQTTHEKRKTENVTLSIDFSLICTVKSTASLIGVFSFHSTKSSVLVSW